MKKITVITLQNVRNYGSVLQALATQKVLESFNYEVDFINYIRAESATPNARAKAWCRNMNFLKRIICTIILYPTFIVQDIIYSRFLKSELNVQNKKYCTESDFLDFPVTSDIYCTGSDQTWNSDWNNGILPPVYLSFVPDNVKKIAYAASFGKSELADEEIGPVRQYLSRYQHISVRENTGVEIINNLGIAGSVQVLDPTLQMDRNFWRQYAGDRKIKKPYVLIYQLNTNRLFDNYAKEFARRKGMKLFRLCNRLDQFFKSGTSILIPEVYDFISLIFYADYVITDSFHATAFSINVNTQFISIYPKDFEGRLDSILKLVGLENRHLKSYNDFSYINAEVIDFSYANSVLDNERKKAYEFLHKALN